MAYVDACENAQDVLEAARQVAKKRQEGYRVKPPKTIPFSAMVSAAYPAKYPDVPIFPDADASAYRPSIAEIQRAICGAFNIQLGDLLSHRRTAGVVLPRQLAMALARRLTLHSFPEIGRKFGGKDHSTVLHAVRKMEPIITRAEAQIELGSPLETWTERAVYWACRIRISIPAPYRPKVVEIST